MISYIVHYFFYSLSLFLFLSFSLFLTLHFFFKIIPCDELCISGSRFKRQVETHTDKQQQVRGKITSLPE